MKNIIKILLVFSVSLIVVGCGGSVDYNAISQDDIDANPTDAAKLSDTQKKEYLKAINKARAVARDCGEYGHMDAVPPLKWNDALYKAAYEHTYDMVENNTFSHEGTGKATDKTGADLNKKSQFYERVAHNGYRYKLTGENITAGTVTDTANEAVQNWIDSPPHCKNLMSPDYKDVGMAYIRKSGTTYINYWTQDFGTPRQ